MINRLARHERGRARLLCAIITWWCIGAAAAEPAKAREAAILARVLSYELTLDERAGDAVGIAVVYKPGNSGSEANAEAWYQGLMSLGAVRIKGRRFFVIKVTHDPKTLAAAVDKEGIDVILVSRGLGNELDAIANVARSRRVLTAADSVDYLQRSSTVCVTQDDDKPKIYISLNNAEQERIRFSSNLLKLTTIVR